MDEVNSKSRIAGRVLEENGRPAVGATITCDGLETKTLFDGSFMFEELEAGSHVVDIFLEGYTRQARNIEVKEGEEVEVEIHLGPELGDAKIYGYVIDEETREPLKEGGSVYMFRPTSNKNSPIDPDTGYYEFAELPPGNYTIWTSILDHEEQNRSVALQDGELRREDFLVKKKEEEEVPWG